MNRISRQVGRSLAGILVISLILLGIGAAYFKLVLPFWVAPRSFPQVGGEIHLPGLDGPVDIYRDQAGVPHIFGTTSHDLFFAQGYVHAQERFWQMDAWRHIGSGRLSEMFGKGQVETDAFLRTLGWRQTAEAEWEGLDPDSKAILEAYALGVNAYLQGHQGSEISLEYAILALLSPDHRVEPWTPIHSPTWGKAMAWDLRSNMDEEIDRSILLNALSAEQVDQLYPPYPDDHPTIVAQAGEPAAASGPDPLRSAFTIPSETLAIADSNSALLDRVLGPSGRGIGSNSWVVSGQFTDSGKPILANDPHLGIQMPSIWYQVGLHCVERSSDCPLNVAGFSFAGVPGVIIGHNDRIAWGFTNNGPDVMDLYIERFNPRDPGQYEVNGAWVDFEVRTEVIEVAGDDPVEIQIRSTRHGPLISDVYGPLLDEGDARDKEFEPYRERAGIDLPQAYGIAVRWTALEPSSPFQAIWGFNKARNWEEFREAARAFHVPAQNLIYADVDGNIGYQMPGNIPVRASGDGRLPVPGWTDEYEWTGYIPFEELPYTLNPDPGYIVTANNQAPARDYPFWITSDWDYGYRAQRIVEWIEAAPARLRLDDMRELQADSLDPGAAIILPIWDEIEFRAASPNQALALDMLRNWDRRSTPDSQAAALYQWFWWNLLQNTLDDDLPEGYGASGGDRYFEVMRHLVGSPADPFWDDRSTAERVETRDEIYANSLIESVTQLEEEYGDDLTAWPRWGQLHTAGFRNQTLGESGLGLIEDLFNRGPFETGGGKSLVNATGWDVGVSFEVDWLPSMRMIVDLADLDRSLTVHTTGQSGHAYHGHYDDLAPLWASGEYYPMWFEPESIKAAAESHLLLLPAE